MIGCGSADSWILDKIINSKGGLHNRITGKIKLEPFNQLEVDQFLINREIIHDRYQVVLQYMAFGGITFYLEHIEKGLSAMQNIEKLCFDRNALFRTEFSNIFKSLFKNSENYIKIIEALNKQNKGLNREELSNLTGIADGEVD